MHEVILSLVVIAYMLGGILLIGRFDKFLEKNFKSYDDNENISC